MIRDSDRTAERPQPSFLQTWRFRHIRTGRGPMMPGPRSEPDKESAFRNWRWVRQAAERAKAPIKAVIPHPSSLG